MHKHHPELAAAKLKPRYGPLPHWFASFPKAVKVPELLVSSVLGRLPRRQGRCCSKHKDRKTLSCAVGCCWRELSLGLHRAVRPNCAAVTNCHQFSSLNQHRNALSHSFSTSKVQAQGGSAGSLPRLTKPGSKRRWDWTPLWRFQE